MKGQFPIGFFVWNGRQEERCNEIMADLYNRDGVLLGKKVFYGNLQESLNKWLVKNLIKQGEKIGVMVSSPADFQHNNQLVILSKPQERYCYEILGRFPSWCTRCVYHQAVLSLA